MAAGTMQGAGVFVLKDDRSLVPMQPAQFELEADFQDLLSDFPALLAGEQMDASSPRRFLLVSPELSVPDQEGGARRWSLDHLFLDQDAVPTLVEVKRQSDTRLRREVIGQMMDYAANGLSHWTVEGLRADYLRVAAEKGRDPAAALAELIGEEADPEAFWAQVRVNLEAGRIRMLFVADLIPPEVRRIVEFLNRQMQPAEVLAVELRQYQGQGLKMLSPLVIGQSQQALQKKGAPAPGRRWTAEEILEALEGDLGAHAAAVALIDWCWSHATGLNLKRSGRGSVGPAFATPTGPLYPFLFDSTGRLTLYLDLISAKPPFSEPQRMKALTEALARTGLFGAEALQAKRPALPLQAFTPEQTQAFLQVMTGFAEALRAAADDGRYAAQSTGLSPPAER